MNTVTVKINSDTAAGRKILREIAANPKIGNIRNPLVPRDENGNVIGISVEEYGNALMSKLREMYGIDEKV